MAWWVHLPEVAGRQQNLTPLKQLSEKCVLDFMRWSLTLRQRCWLEWSILGFGLPGLITAASSLLRSAIPAALHGSLEEKYLFSIAGGVIAEWIFVVAAWFILRANEESFSNLGAWRLGNWAGWCLALFVATFTIASNLRFLPGMGIPVYRSEVEKLAAAEQRFTATMPPLEALRAWMLLFIDHIAGKMLIVPVMNTIAGGSLRLMEGSRSLIHTAFVVSVERAIVSGDLRSDTDPNDFVRALVGVFHTTALPGWEPSARRLVDILIAGSRSTPKHPSTPPRTRQT
jgi:hypothetical protein